MDETKPKSKAPVSPINMRAGVKLNFKKAVVAPANAKAKMAKLK